MQGNEKTIDATNKTMVAPSFAEYCPTNPYRQLLKESPFILLIIIVILLLLPEKEFAQYKLFVHREIFNMYVQKEQ